MNAPDGVSQQVSSTTRIIWEMFAGKSRIHEATYLYLGAEMMAHPDTDDHSWINYMRTTCQSIEEARL